MKSTDFLIETIVDDAAEMHQDHEVQMARKECYHAAENAIALHKLLRSINESTNLEAWVSSKITLANDYLNTVREHLEYQILQGDGQLLSNAPVIAEEDSKKKLVDSENLSEVTPEQRREKFQHELGNERGNNIAVYINDKLWRVVPGRGLADSAEEYNYLQYWRRKAALKTQQTGSKWEAHLTGQEPGKPVRNVKESSKLQTIRNLKNSVMMQKDVSVNLNEMDKSAPQPGRDGKISHSTYGSRDKEGDDYFKGKEVPVKPITVKKMEKDALDILKKKGLAEGIIDNPGQPDSPVAQAIIRRILLQRTDLLTKYGPEKVSSAVDEVADFVGDVDEIGSSDVSGWVRHVEQMLDNMGEGVAEGSKEKTPGIALSKAYRKDFDDKKPGQDRKETALTGAYSKTGKPGGELKKQGVAEAGPFSYGKAPRKGSVADLAAKKRREQERGKQPIEPKDQQVGVAKVTKGVAEGLDKELYGLHIGDTVKAEINGRRVQGDVIDIFSETMEVELLLRGPNAGKTVIVDVRDTEYLGEQSVLESDNQSSTMKANLQKPRQGPLKPQTGGGKHRDKKREQKSGIAKHRKSIADALNETGAGAVATVVNPGGKPKSQVGSLFGGTYKQATVKETDFSGEKAKPKQIPGDQVRGNEPAVRKNGKTAFLGRLVGNQ